MQIRIESPKIFQRIHDAREKRLEYKEQWHPYFLLIPRFIWKSGERHLVWLETVESKLEWNFVSLRFLLFNYTRVFRFPEGSES